MTGYVISILGVVIAGVVIDIVIPSGNINKYIKSIFSIFVVAVLISPIFKVVNNFKGVNLDTHKIEVDENLLNFIYKSQVSNKETNIETDLKERGFEGIDVDIQFSIESNKLKINSCVVILKNMSTIPDNQHIDMYEEIYEVVNDYTGLDIEEITYER